MRKLRLRWATLALGLAACERAPQLVDPALNDAGQLSARVGSAQPVIGPGVLEAVRAGGEARLVVALSDDGIAEVTRGRGRGADPASMRARGVGVATAQDEALTAVTAAEFRVDRRFAMVPALAGVVRGEGALRRLAANRRVRRIDLDVGGSGELAASVSVIGANLRHTGGNTGSGITVGIMDSGIDLVHPDLAGSVTAEACFGFRTPTTGFCANGTSRQFGAGAGQDNAGHGTHVSGIVASRGVSASRGVAPAANLVAIKVLDNCSFSGCFYASAELIAGWDWILANNGTLGIDVVNMSLGTSALFAGDCDNAAAYTVAGATAVNSLRSIGVLVVASAGNNGSTTGMGFPACLQQVISVGASNNVDAAAAFTNSNAQTDLFGPGVGIMSSLLNGTTRPASGTSMAAPHVAGCAALLLQAGDATTPATLETRLETSPSTVTRNGITYPRLDCRPTANAAPTANPGGPYGGIEGSAISLNGGGSTDPDDDALTFSWTFGDGSPVESGPAGTHATRSHTYADNCTVNCDAGGYLVTLTVSDGQGGTNTATTRAAVTNATPLVTAGVDRTIVSGESVTLLGSFTDAGVNDAPWNWLINWGLAPSTSGTRSTPGAITASRTYLASGAYTVSLGVTDKDGATGSASFTLTVRRLRIGIDVLPGSAENPFSLNGGGVLLPVAVLSSATFDARALIDAEQVTLGDGVGSDTPVNRRPNGRLMANVEDVNGDGRADVVLFFSRESLRTGNDVDSTTTALTLRATLRDGRQAMGTDVLRVVP